MTNRREFMAGAALFVLATGLPSAAVATLPKPAPRMARLLTTVSQIVLPRSATAGAGDVGVGAFLALAFAHGLDASQGCGTWLEAELAHRAAGDFLALPPSKQAALVRALDAEAFPPGPPPASPSRWVTIKGLILTGYYTSEVGAAQELQYSLIPGRWDADVALTKGARAFSSDWTAVEFG